MSIAPSGLLLAVVPVVALLLLLDVAAAPAQADLPPLLLANHQDAKQVTHWELVQTPNGTVTRESVPGEDGKTPVLRLSWRILTNKQDWLISKFNFAKPIDTAGYRYLDLTVCPGPGNRFANLKVVTDQGAFEDALTNIAPTVIPERWAQVRLDLAQAGIRGKILHLAFYQGTHWRTVEVGQTYTLDVGDIHLTPGSEEAYAPPVLEARTSWSLYRASESAAVLLWDRRAQPAPVALRVTREGAEVFAQSVKVTAPGQAVTLGTLPQGAYRIELDGQPAGAFAVAADRPTAYARQNAQGGVCWEDQPVFPLGFYFMEENATDAELAEAADAGFNCLPRPCVGPANTLRVLERVWQASSQRMRVLTGPYDNPGKQPELAYWREVLAEPAVVQHPALWGWYLDDEPLLANLSGIQETAAFLRQADPHHPTFIMLNTPLVFDAYSQFVDLLGGDVYPYPTRPLSAVGDFTQRLVQSAHDRKPAVVAIQAFRDVGLSAPPPAQVRAMTYSAIAGGARGILYYAFRHQGGQPREQAWRLPNTDPALWSELKRIATELKPLAAALACGVNEAAPRGEHPQAVQTRCFTHEGQCYLLLVNTGKAPAPCVMQLPTAGALRSCLDDRQFVGPTLAVTLQPFEVLLLCGSVATQP